MSKTKPRTVTRRKSRNTRRAVRFSPSPGFCMPFPGRSRRLGRVESRPQVFGRGSLWIYSKDPDGPGSRMGPGFYEDLSSVSSVSASISSVRNSTI